MRVSVILFLGRVLSVVQLLNCRAAIGAEKNSQEPTENVIGCATPNFFVNQNQIYAFEKNRNGADPPPKG